MDEKTIEDALQRDGFCVATIDGISMRPMLKGRRDMVILKRPDRRLRRFEVALYRRNSGRWVLHRIISVRNGGYDIRGDNCLRVEKAIEDHQVFGVLTGFYRAGRYISCDNRAYRLYVRLWHILFPLRAVYLAIGQLANITKNRSDEIGLAQTDAKINPTKRSRF